MSEIEERFKERAVIIVREKLAEAACRIAKLAGENIDGCQGIRLIHSLFVKVVADVGVLPQLGPGKPPLFGVSCEMLAPFLATKEGVARWGRHET